MYRYFEVNICVSLEFIGFVLTCFEDDKVVLTKYYNSQKEANRIGHKFLSKVLTKADY